MSNKPRAPRTVAEMLSHAATIAPTSGVIAPDGDICLWPAIEEQSRILACRLIDLGVQPGDRIAVHHPKSVSSFIAMHAAMRAHAVAVPIDPLGARLQCEALVAQIEPAVVIGDAATLARLVPTHVEHSQIPLIVNGDSDRLMALGHQLPIVDFHEATHNLATTQTLPSTIQAEDPAYIIFTSGSTGRPKGIVHTHASCLAYAHQAVEFHELDPTARLAGTPPLHFDMSTLELYAVPLAGATAVTISEAEQRFPASLSQRFERDRVTHLYAVPFQLRQLEQRGALAERDLSAIRHVAFGGEQFAPGALAEVMAAFGGADFLNVYGPAEVNAVTTHRFVAGNPPVDSVPIGMPWPNVETRIVDTDNNEVAVGEAGELLIAAPSRMAGYWRDADLTAQKLVGPDQPSRPRSAWYRTGDVVRTEVDGTLVFLGRQDNQVKVRGVRLELESIESVLADAPDVEHVIAGRIVDDNGIDQIAAFVVMNPGCELDGMALRKWAAGHLAPVAVPVTVFEAATLTMTASGKIDRKTMRQQLQLCLTPAVGTTPTPNQENA